MTKAVCGAGTPAREMPKARAHKRKVNALQAATLRPFTLFLAVLREIFDETAYERFLIRQRVASSPESYDDFLRESANAKSRRPRCC